jgi:RNA polymerase sigma factor for flagellar operon FliA
MRRMEYPLSPAQREEMILQYYPLVRTIAGRMAKRLPSNVDLDELVMVGTVGLIDAIDRFDPARGVPFKSYAEIRVRGAIVDALRESDWVPRSVRRKYRLIDTARVELRQRLDRDPTREEVAARLGISIPEYEELLADARISSLTSIDIPLDEDGGSTIGDTVKGQDVPVDDAWIAEEVTAEVKAAVNFLPDKERTVVSLYYIQGLSLKEIGGLLGVTESRACQLRGAGVNRLKARLKSVVG